MENQEPIFKESVEMRTENGDLKGEVAVKVTPWAFKNENSGKTNSGLTMEIRVAKLGKTARSVFIDPTDSQVKDLISKAYKAVAKSE